MAEKIFTSTELLGTIHKGHAFCEDCTHSFKVTGLNEDTIARQCVEFLEGKIGLHAPDCRRTLNPVSI
jgi:hypothetical protein